MPSFIPSSCFLLSIVLCGRGGAALRHAGNQTYRKLVSLNKGLYITCLKTEKLKISRSIVAAIREKKGRFLEKDAASGTWYDIGDKKAVEKTSQALREGQPKLRQQIVEMGGGAAGAASLIESQFGPQAAAAVAGSGLYSQQGQMQGGPRSIMTSQMNAGNGGMRQQMMNQQDYAHMQQQQQQQQQQQMNGMPFDDIQNDLMNRLSLHDDNGGMPQQGNMRQQMQMRQMMPNGMGMPVGDSPQMQMMSEYAGGYGGGQPQMNQLGGIDDATSGIPMDNSFRAAMRGMASPPGSVGNSLHSTQHTLDFSSIHSMQDYMNGMSGHSMGLSSNHSMGPPSAHLPTMSSISRQQQIDERYPQNIGLDPQAMSQSFRRQVQDSRPPQPPPQPTQPEQHTTQQQRVHSINSQQMKMHSGQPSRAYNGMAMLKETDQDYEPVQAFPERARNGYPEQEQQLQQERQSSNGYPQGNVRTVPSSSRNYGNEQGRSSMTSRRTYDDHSQTKQGHRSSSHDHRNAPPDRNISSSTDGTSKNGTNQSIFSLNQSMASITSNSTTPSVLRPEARQKMDRRNMFARMKFTRPPSIRDSKMGLSGPSTHSQMSTGDGMPEIHMVESQLSLHSTMSGMTDGASAKMPNNSVKGAFSETAKAVDHSSRSDYMDVLASGSKHSLMSGLSKISDHSLNDASIFSSLSKQIGNVSTRSMAMSEISVIDVAERDGEDEPSSNHEESNNDLTQKQ